MEENQPIVAQGKDNKLKIIHKLLLGFSIGLLFVTVVVLVILFIKKRGRITELIYNPARDVNNASIDVAKEKLELLPLFEKRQDITKPSIFIAISSYRDPELCYTLRDIYEKAMFPERLFFGILEQNDKSDPYSSHAKNAGIPLDQIRIHSMDYREAKGPTWARHLCEKLWRGEDYHLMTDSHMRSEPGWDCHLIDMLLRCDRPQMTVLSKCSPLFNHLLNNY